MSGFSTESTVHFQRVFEQTVVFTCTAVKVGPVRGQMRVREEVPHINLIFRPTLLLPACCLLIYVLCLAKTHIGGTPIKSGWDPSCGWLLVSLAAMLRGLTQKASMR